MLLDGSHLLGRPTTVVFAETRDRDGIIEALSRGHAYITDAPDGPHLEIAIGETPMGGIAASSTGVELSIAAKGAAGDELRLVAQTGVLTRLTIPTDEWQHTIPLPSGLSFVRAEIFARSIATDEARDVCRALSNPIYFRG